MILTIRTDKPEAEIGLFQANGARLSYHTWQANRQLANTLLLEIKKLLSAQQADWNDITGVIAFQGPGSFTGLRIGLTVANTVAYGLDTPIVATQGDKWVQNGITRLQKSQNDRLALPHYGGEAHITLPKK